MEAVLVRDWRQRRTGSAEEEGHELPTRLRIDTNCDCVLLPANRSTGVLLVPSAATASSGGGAGNGDGEDDASMAIPVGETYYHSLREAWSHPPPPPVGPQTMASALPPPADVDSLDDSIILDSIELMEGPPLSPAVPLTYMIDLLTPQWEDEGLYDVARRREQRSQAIEQETGRRV